MTTTLAIDVFSDVVCPWCFIGATRLEQALAALSSEVQAEVCYHPFYLDPTVPKGAGRLAVSGAQPLSVLQGAIRQALAEAGPSEAPSAS